MGRAPALAALADAMDGVIRNRAPAIIGLVGPDGIGRSRLMRRLWARYDNEFSEVMVLRGYVAEVDRAHDPYRPFGRLLRNALGLSALEDAEQTRLRIADAVARLNPASTTDALSGIDFFLGLDMLGAGKRSGEGAAASRTRAFATFAWLLRQQASRGPLLILLEDLSEATAEGLSLLGWLHDHLVDCPLMMLCEVDEASVEQQPDFFHALGHAILKVGPLERGPLDELASRLAGLEAAPPAALGDVIAEVTGGRPAAVAQIVTRLREAEVITDAGWSLPAEGPVEISALLSEDQVARLRLEQCDPADVSWLARGALIGATFTAEGLIPLARAEAAEDIMARWAEGPDPQQIEEALERLVGEGILIQLAPGRYRFTELDERAALLSEVSAEAQAAAHGVIAEWMESRLDPEGEGWMEIAGHYAASGSHHRAAFYFIQAGQRAQRRFAHEQAIEAYTAARALLGKGDALPLMDVHHALGTLYVTLGRYGEAERSFQHMLTHAWVLDHKGKAGAALDRLGRLCREQARYAQARALFEQARDLFQAADDGPGVAAALDDLGQVALRVGDRETALGLFTEALDLRRRLKDPRSIAVSLTNLGRVQRDTGFLQIAEKTITEGLQIRRRIKDAHGEAASYLALSELYLYGEETAQAKEMADEALAAAEVIGALGLKVKAVTMQASVASAMGDHDRARRRGSEAMGLAEQLGDVRAIARARRALATAQCAHESWLSALATLKPAIELARRHKEQHELALCLHLKGCICAWRCPVDLNAAALAAAEAFDDRSEADELGSINRLIDDVLEDERGDMAPEIAALPEEARRGLLDGQAAFSESLSLLEDLGDQRAQIQVIHDAVPTLTALGEIERGRRLAQRRGQLEAVRLARAERVS